MFVYNMLNVKAIDQHLFGDILSHTLKHGVGWDIDLEYLMCIFSFVLSRIIS